MENSQKEVHVQITMGIEDWKRNKSILNEEIGFVKKDSHVLNKRVADCEVDIEAVRVWGILKYLARQNVTACGGLQFDGEEAYLFCLLGGNLFSHYAIFGFPAPLVDGKKIRTNLRQAFLFVERYEKAKQLIWN